MTLTNNLIRRKHVFILALLSFECLLLPKVCNGQFHWGKNHRLEALKLRDMLAQLRPQKYLMTKPMVRMIDFVIFGSKNSYYIYFGDIKSNFFWIWRFTYIYMCRLTWSRMMIKQDLTQMTVLGTYSPFNPEPTHHPRKMMIPALRKPRIGAYWCALFSDPCFLNAEEWCIQR